MMDDTIRHIHDEENPDFIFDSTDSSLLVQIVNRDIDAIMYASSELAKRGQNRQGFWVGFEEANNDHYCRMELMRKAGLIERKI